jgi:hypothetical protein
MWDNKDLPRGHRANLIRRGLYEREDRGKRNLVAYSLFPVEMEKRLIESLHLIQRIIDDTAGYIQKYAAVNQRIKEVVKDEFFADLF